MSSNIVTSISIASIFLTRPFLFLGIKPTIVSAITTFLQEFLAVSGGESQTLKFQSASLPSLPETAASSNADTIALIEAYFGGIPTIESASVASANLAVPIPLALACHFFSFAWNGWFMALGGSEFKLVLNPRCVYVIKKSDGNIGIVWTDMNLSAGIIRSVTAPIRPAPPSLSSPVDTSDSEDTDTNASRPSSRSSNYSSYSFSSSSASSQSSISSFGAAPTKFKPSYTTSFPIKTTKQVSFTRATIRPTLTPIMNTHCAAISPSTIPAAPVNVAPTRYIYQGGVSAVLTGGVMLGNSAAATRMPQTAQTKSLLPHRAHAGSSSSWRRTSPVAA